MPDRREAGKAMTVAVSRSVTRIVAIGLAAPFGAAAQAEARLDSLVRAEMERLHVPGVAAAAVDSGRVVWIGTYGLADVERGIPVTRDTPFQIASVSKPVTATILLSLWADGRLDLDRDVEAYLPFAVRNPHHPDVPITARRLLRHRSSIADNGTFYEPLWAGGGGDPTVPLGEYLRGYLSADGADYDPGGNFLDAPPGPEWRYCNTCYALLGYLAEVISGEPFEELSRRVLFEPLGMTSTHWFLRDFDAADVAPALPYRFAADTGFVSDGHNGYPDWPAGQLRTSIHDLSRFLAVYANGGVVGGQTLIDPRIVDLMAPVRADVGFHTWSQGALRDRRLLYSHGGGDAGVNTFMALRRQGGRGAIVLMNGNGNTLPMVEEIFLAIDSLRVSGR